MTSAEQANAVEHLLRDEEFCHVCQRYISAADRGAPITLRGLRWICSSWQDCIKYAESQGYLAVNHD